MENLKEYLDEKYAISSKYYLNSSLLSCVRRFNDTFNDDVSTVDFAFISAMYDYQMKVSHLINRFNHIINFLEKCDLSLQDLTSDRNFESLRNLILNNYRYFHRFDPKMKEFFTLLNVITKKLDLEELAQSSYDPSKREPLKIVMDEILKAIYRFTNLRLIPKPESKSPKKRLTLFLRWVVRPEYPDLGIWKFIDTSHLYVSLDSGILRVFQRMTGTNVKNNWSSVLEITNYFRKINPSDPSKYDYVLSRPAILDICKKNLDDSDCDACLLSDICLTGRKIVERKDVIVEEEKEKTRHDYIKDLFKSANPWNAECVREKYINGRADIVCYQPSMKHPEKMIIIEVKVVLTFNGLRQLLGYLRTAVNRWRGIIKEFKGAIVCEDFLKNQEQKILEVSEYYGIEIYKFNKDNFVKVI